MILRRIKDLFKVKNGQFINKKLSKIEQMGRFRAVREHQWDQLIDKIFFMIQKSPFNFKVYLDQNNPDLVIMMRIYEPGKEEDLDESK